MSLDFSVIVPVWNLEIYISRCLDSVLNQSFKGSYEIVVVLGNSQDNTENIVKKYMEKNNNIRLVKCLVPGIMNLRICGITHSKGDYLAFIDADDYYDPKFLEVMYEQISKGYDIVNCSFFIDKGGHIKKNKYVSNKLLSRNQACKALLRDTYMRGFMWSKVFRREVFDLDKLVLPKTKEQFFEDTMFIFELFTRVKQVKSIKTPIYHYVCNSKSVTNSPNLDRVHYHLSAYLVVKLLCERSNDKKLIKIFRHKVFWCRCMLFYDALLIRKATHKSAIGIYRSNKIGLRILKSRKPVNLDNYEWKQYVLDCLKPLDKGVNV